MNETDRATTEKCFLSSSREKVTRVVYTVSPEAGKTPPGFTDRDLRKPNNNTIETALKEAGLDIEVYTYHEDDDQFVSGNHRLCFVVMHAVLCCVVP